MAYSENVKKEAKRLYLSGYSCNEAAEKLNLNPDTVFRWRNRYKWDEETSDDSIAGLKKHIAAITASEDDLTEAQTRKLDKLAKAQERIERSAARESKDARGRKRKKEAAEALRPAVIGDIRARAYDTLYQYQRDWLDDDSRFRLILKSRQTGFSYLTGFEVMMGALTRDENQIVVSASQDQSDIVRRYCTLWCDKYEVEYLEDGNSLIMPGGKRCIFLPCNPRTVQGYTGDLYLDEFAWHMKNRLMWSTVIPIATQGRKRISVISTPYTETDMFGELVMNPDKYNRFSRHKVTIYDAKNDGLPVDLDDIKSLLDDISFAQAYECKFFTDALSLLSPEEVRAAFDEDCLHYVQGWVNGGVDIGRYKDLTALILAEQFMDGGDKYVAVRKMDTLQNVTFDSQKSYLASVVESWRIKRMAIDATGIGANLAEDMQKMYPGKVQPTTFTREKKEEWALGVKKLFESGRIRIPNDRDLVMQLHAIKRKPTERGFTYDADRNEQVKHADLFWALALAVRDFAGRRRVLTSGNVKLLHR
ncbi:terminase large subunit domain-containing protein [Cloacibacillus evryensis]|uniref:terminase large subunit domain-containing protein n=1 Tax=Cloacibacillus evryensis TaxID=508460 RepID=UPI00210A0C1B|nr:terminase family protein [Cloacibacillus evryensis]MCQ4765377.1 terminase family protein [Cloacibacillus evryensis]